MDKPVIQPFPPAPELGDTVEVFDQKAFALVQALEPRRLEINQVVDYIEEAKLGVEADLTEMQQVRDVTIQAAQSADTSATNAAASESAAKKHLDDTRTLIQNFDPTGVLPNGAAVDAPLVVATEQGGVRFSDRTLNEGDDPQGFFGIGENQSPRVKELLPILHASNLYF